MMSLETFQRHLQKNAGIKGVPIFGGIELTTRCNLRCRMCYVSKNSTTHGEIDAKQWIRLGEELFDAQVLNLIFTGGEPLIRSDFKQIYLAYSKLGFRLNLFTNGTLITKDFAKWISQAPPATIDVTLYGASEETYFKLCGDSEAYHKTREGIENLLSQNLNVRIKTTIVKSNLADFGLIKAIVDSYQVSFVPSSLVHGNHKDGIVNLQHERLSPEEMDAFYADNNKDIGDLPDHSKNIVIQNIKRPPMACSAGKSAFFINYKGELFPCPLFSEFATYPLINGFRNAWKKLREDVQLIKLAEECIQCNLRSICPSCPPRMFLETGSYTGHSDYLCAITKHKKDMMQIIPDKCF